MTSRTKPVVWLLAVLTGLAVVLTMSITTIQSTLLNREFVTEVATGTDFEDGIVEVAKSKAQEKLNIPIVASVIDGVLTHQVMTPIIEGLVAESYVGRGSLVDYQPLDDQLEQALGNIGPSGMFSRMYDRLKPKLHSAIDGALSDQAKHLRGVVVNTRDAMVTLCLILGFVLLGAGISGFILRRQWRVVADTVSGGLIIGGMIWGLIWATTGLIVTAQLPESMQQALTPAVRAAVGQMFETTGWLAGTLMVVGIITFWVSHHYKMHVASTKPIG
ncbi:hypothetical protein [Lacticaseibacillus kribbianus]|uniref:hypothetical protein n=1 Tax=Lacticaseibacillus kribbianus TaxID=2926292 RepID=UPI001CD21579|nr:hypothetical protein [Lacticaseibacillus kribbianus]